MLFRSPIHIQAPSFTLVLACGLAATALATEAPAAAPANEWTFGIQLEPMYVKMYGYEPDVLDVYSLDGPGGEENPDSTTDLDFDGGAAVRGEVNARRGEWGLGATGFWFDSDGSASDEGTESRYPNDDTYFVDPSGFAIWTIDTSCCGNERFDFTADAEMQVWSLDLYAFWSPYSTESTDVRLLFGAQLGGLDTDYDSTLTRLTNSGFGNHVDFSSRAKMDILAGPMIGVTAEHQLGRFRFEGLLTQSVLFGKADLRSVASDRHISDFMVTVDHVQQTFDWDRTAVIPVTDIRLKAMFDVTQNLSIGIGFFSSMWWNADTPPNLWPRDYTDGFESALLVPEKVENLHGKKRDNLFFIGGLGAVEFRF